MLKERYESSDTDGFEVEGWELRDFQLCEIAPTVYLLTYALWGQGDRLTRRLSVWSGSQEAGWKVLYHQGTASGVLLRNQGLEREAASGGAAEVEVLGSRPSGGTADLGPFHGGRTFVLGREGDRAGGGHLGDPPAVGQQFTGVVEEDDSVTEQAPALFVVCGDGLRGAVVGAVGARAGRLVWAHGLPRFSGNGAGLAPG